MKLIKILFALKDCIYSNAACKEAAKCYNASMNIAINSTQQA